MLQSAAETGGNDGPEEADCQVGSLDDVDPSEWQVLMRLGPVLCSVVFISRAAHTTGLCDGQNVVLWRSLEL